MRFHYKQRKTPFINIVSMIDILVLLLIFFIVTTTFRKQEPRVQIKLPESTTAEKSEQPQEPTIIYATKDQKLFIGEQEIPLSQLSVFLKKKKTDNAPVALKADTDMPTGFLIKIMDASKEAGVGNLSLFTEEKKPSQP